MSHVDAAELGRRVRETRLRRGFTQQELASAIHLERTALNKIETGGRKVSALELADIAGALTVRMASFFTNPLPAVVSHRSAQGLDTADSRIDEQLQSIADDVHMVNGLQSILVPLPQTPWAVPQSQDDAEVMASRVRTTLGLDTDAPVRSISRRCADLGLLFFSRELGHDSADAGTILLEERGVTLVNSSSKVGRRRLAAAHEMAHFLTADEYTVDWRVASDTSPTEACFDRFARALLLPVGGLTRLWGCHVDESGLRSAAVVAGSTFQVDMSTLARRLTELNLIDAAEASSVRTVRTTRGDIIEHDLHPGNELDGETQPRVYQQAILDLVRHERISRERALDLLWNGLSDEDLPHPRVRDRNGISDVVS